MSNIARFAKDPSVDTNPKYLDARLSDRGMQQAAALNDLVRHWGVELVVTSPLTRAIQTACLAFHNTPTPIRADPLLTEYFSHLIECRGREVGDILDEPTLRALNKFSDVCLKEVPAPQWWSQADCDDVLRPDKFLTKLGEMPEERVSVVSHFGTINMFAVNNPSEQTRDRMDFLFPTFGNCDVLETKWLLNVQ